MAVLWAVTLLVWQLGTVPPLQKDLLTSGCILDFRNKSHNILCGCAGYCVNCRHILIIVQRDATQSSLFIILQVHCTCSGCQPHPSSGVHKTVTTASGTGHAATAFQRGQATLEGGSCTKIWPVPEAVVIVLCAPDGGCGSHPKHVQWTRRIINRLLCVASRWTIMNTDQRCTEP